MEKFRDIVIVQARMGSSRLPGKGMAEIADGLPLTKVVLARCLQAKIPQLVVLATSVLADCEPLCNIALNLGCPVVRGDEFNVLSRFIRAIELYPAENVIRVCADNPFVSPVEIDKLIKYFTTVNLDYACNNTSDCGLPDGFGCEIVRAELLQQISLMPDITTSDCEHVTKYIINRPQRFRLGILKADPELFAPNIRLDINTFEDLQRIRKLCANLSIDNSPFWESQEIIATYKRLFGEKQDTHYSSTSR